MLSLTNLSLRAFALLALLLTSTAAAPSPEATVRSATITEGVQKEIQGVFVTVELEFYSPVSNCNLFCTITGEERPEGRTVIRSKNPKWQIPGKPEQASIQVQRNIRISQRQQTVRFFIPRRDLTVTSSGPRHLLSLWVFLYELGEPPKVRQMSLGGKTKLDLSLPVRRN
jgi:hypothetical protein